MEPSPFSAASQIRWQRNVAGERPGADPKTPRRGDDSSYDSSRAWTRAGGEVASTASKGSRML